MQVSSSKKWLSKPALDEQGVPILQKNGKPVLQKSYSVLQDDFFQAMRNAGYSDVERGERGSSEEHLTVTQFKVEREQERLEQLTAQTQQKKQQAASLEKKIENIQKQQIAVQKVEQIEPHAVPFSSKVMKDRSEYENLAAAAKKFYHTLFSFCVTLHTLALLFTLRSKSTMNNAYLFNLTQHKRWRASHYQTAGCPLSLKGW